MRSGAIGIVVGLLLSASAQTQTIFALPSFNGVIPEIAAAATDRTQSYTRRSISQRQSWPAEVIYFKQSWMTPHYSLWSQAEGTVAYNSDASFILNNMDAQAIHDGNQASRWALAWDDPTGTDSTLHITAPTNYGTATNIGMSIYEDTLQKMKTMARRCRSSFIALSVRRMAVRVVRMMFGKRKSFVCSRSERSNA